MDETIRVDDAWDAGRLGCGELVLRLALRMRDLRPGAVLELTATDLGAPHDIPAWCRMTGHALVRAEHPRYLIRRKDS
jgi:tRNA 2-thiouridine synthesizing protein A